MSREEIEKMSLNDQFREMYKRIVNVPKHLVAELTEPAVYSGAYKSATSWYTKSPEKLNTQKTWCFPKSIHYAPRGTQEQPGRLSRRPGSRQEAPKGFREGPNVGFPLQECRFSKVSESTCCALIIKSMPCEPFWSSRRPDAPELPIHQFSLSNQCHGKHFRAQAPQSS